MYTVGLVSESTLRTYCYTSFEEADKEFKSWVKIFKKNNEIAYSTTVIDRDSDDVITGVRTIFRKAHTREDAIMFLSGSNN